jgi:HD-GYP domain-containing protein (c-di-GMP phosphodiesterase class II)
MSQPDLMVNLIDIRLEDDYLFGHSVNVCVLALVTGISAGLNNKQLVDLGVGAILHDVGKGVLPRNILYKPGPLTNSEFAVVKTHTSEGFSILKDMTHARGVVALVGLLILLQAAVAHYMGNHFHSDFGVSSGTQ